MSRDCPGHRIYPYPHPRCQYRYLPSSFQIHVINLIVHVNTIFYFLLINIIINIVIISIISRFLRQNDDVMRFVATTRGTFDSRRGVVHLVVRGLDQAYFAHHQRNKSSNKTHNTQQTKQPVPLNKQQTTTTRPHHHVCLGSALLQKE